MLWYQLSHTPNSSVWSAKGKYTPMPPKPWPTSYLLKFRHDLTRLGRLPTCKSRNPQTVTHHTTQNVHKWYLSSIIYLYTLYQNVYTTIGCRSSIYVTYDTTKLNMTKKTIHDVPRWWYTDPPPSNGPHVKSASGSSMDNRELTSWDSWGSWPIYICKKKAK